MLVVQRYLHDDLTFISSQAEEKSTFDAIKNLSAELRYNSNLYYFIICFMYFCFVKYNKVLY